MAQPATERRSGIQLFTIRGIQIRLDYSWFIVFFLILWSLSAGYFPQAYPDQARQSYWLAGFVTTLLFFFSVITHELAHSLMALRAGIKIPEITLFIFGGMARLSEDARDAKTEFTIAVVGPLTSFALAGIFWLLQTALRDSPFPILVEMFGYLTWINIALAVFNLLPGYPLDGGRLLRAFWWWKTGSELRATKVASAWGKGFAIALMVIGGLQIFSGAPIGGLWLIFIGMFLRGMAQTGYQELLLRKSIEGTNVADVMIRNVVTTPADLPLRGLIADYFLRYGYHGFPVTQDGKTLGVVSVKEVSAVPELERNTRFVREVMTPLHNELKISPDTSLVEALKRMTETNQGRLIVMRNGDMVGMITQNGLLRFMQVQQELRYQSA